MSKRASVKSKRNLLLSTTAILGSFAGYRGTYMSRIKSHGGRAGVSLVW